MPSVRPANQNVKRKGSGLLQGLLASLYAGGSAQPNPAYSANPGAEPFTNSKIDANAPPFKARGIFGGKQADTLNNQVSIHGIVQQQAANIQEAQRHKEETEGGEAARILFNNMSPQQKIALNIPQLGYDNLPPAEQYRLIKIAAGQRFTNGGLQSLPGSNIESELTPFGEHGGKLNLFTNEQLIPESTQHTTTTEQVPVGNEKTLDLETGKWVQKMVPKVTQTPTVIPGHIAKLTGRMTPEVVDKTRAGSAGPNMAPDHTEEADIEAMKNITPKNAGANIVNPGNIPNTINGVPATYDQWLQQGSGRANVIQSGYAEKLPPVKTGHDSLNKGLDKLPIEPKEASPASGLVPAIGGLFAGQGANMAELGSNIVNHGKNIVESLMAAKQAIYKPEGEELAHPQNPFSTLGNLYKSAGKTALGIHQKLGGDILDVLQGLSGPTEDQPNNPEDPTNQVYRDMVVKYLKQVAAKKKAESLVNPHGGN